MAESKITEGALKALFGAMPVALSGNVLRVTYPSLAEYGARAQADMTALAKLRSVRSSCVSASVDGEAEFASENALSGAQCLTVVFD